MIDWERGLMKGKEGWIIYSIEWNGCFREKFMHIYILYKLSHYYSSMRMGVHDHSYLYVVIVEDHVEIPTGLYVHPTVLNLFRCLAGWTTRVGSSFLLAMGPLLCGRNAIVVKGLHPSSCTLSDVSPRAIY